MRTSKNILSEKEMELVQMLMADCTDPFPKNKQNPYLKTRGF